MIRFVGALMIFAAFAGAGLSASAMYARRVEELEAFARLVSYVGTQIDSFLTPLDKIYAAFENRVLERCGFLPALRKNGGVAALSACRGSLCLTRSEACELEAFFDGLGKHNASDEAKHCAYFEKQLSELLETARAERHSKGRVCRTLGMLLGLMIAIVLL